MFLCHFSQGGIIFYGRSKQIMWIWRLPWYSWIVFSVIFIAVISMAYHSFLFSVKLRIKSFNIPELFINVPENATIGSLKVLYGHLQVTD